MYSGTGKTKTFLEVISRPIMIQNKNAPKCAQWVWGIDWRNQFFFVRAKTDFGARLGTFLARVHSREEVQGGENAKIGHFGKLP